MDINLWKSSAGGLYHNSLNRRPGGYFLPGPWRPGIKMRLAFKQGAAFIEHPASTCSYEMGSGCHSYNTCIVLAYARSTIEPWQAKEALTEIVYTRRTVSFWDNVRVYAHMHPVSVCMDCAATPTLTTRYLFEARRLLPVLGYVCPVSKWGKCLFEGGIYLRKYGMSTRSVVGNGW